MAKFKKVNLRLTYINTSDPYKKIPQGCVLEFDFENNADRDNFVSENNSVNFITTLGVSFKYSIIASVSDFRAVIFLKALNDKNEPFPLNENFPLKEAIISWLEITFPDAYSFKEIDETYSFSPAQTPAPPQTQKIEKRPETQEKEILPPLKATQNEKPKEPQPINVSKESSKKHNRLLTIKKYMDNFFQLPAIRPIVFHLKLFFKMPSQYPATIGILSTFLTLRVSLSYLSWSWALAIPCALGAGLILGLATYLRNKKYEEYFQDVIPITGSEKQEQAYEEGKIAGRTWLLYFQSCFSSSWILEPKHYNAGLIDTIDEEQKKALKTWEDERFNRTIIPK